MQGELLRSAIAAAPKAPAFWAVKERRTAADETPEAQDAFQGGSCRKVSTARNDRRRPLDKPAVRLRAAWAKRYSSMTQLQNLSRPVHRGVPFHAVGLSLRRAVLPFRAP